MRSLYIYSAPFVTSVVCYLNSLGGEFVHDDVPAILKNPDVVTGSQPLLDAFNHDYWGKPMWDKSSHKSYRPLTVLSFRLNRVLGGVSPGGYHLVNVVGHAVVSCLFTHMCHTQVFKGSGHLSLLAGLLFAVHPIHTEVVANVVSRAEIFSAIMFLMSYRYFTCSQQKTADSFISLLKCVLAAGAALLCKEQGVTVLGVCWVQQCHSVVTRSLARSHGLIKLSAITIAMTLLMWLRMALLYGSPPNFLREDNPTSFEDKLSTRCMSRWYIYSLNALLLIWPCRLSHDWQYGTVPLVSEFSDVRNLQTLVFVGVLAVLCCKALSPKESCIMRSGLLLLIVPFLPASNLLFQVGFVLAERTLYIPSMGFTILLVHGFHSLCQRIGQKSCSFFLTFLLCGFAAKTVLRNTDWHSRESLARSGIQTCPQNAKIQFNYANVLRDYGFHNEAEMHYQKAISLWPEYASAHNNLATLVLSRNTSYAKHHLRKAITACPEHANAHFNLGTQLWLEENYESAKAHLKKTVDMDPDCAACHLNMASIYCDTRELTKAISHFHKALNLTTDVTLVTRRYISCLNSLESIDHSNKKGSSQASEESGTYSSENSTQSASSNQSIYGEELSRDTSSHHHLILKNTPKHKVDHKYAAGVQPNMTIQLAILLAKTGNHQQAATLLDEVLDYVHENETKAEIYFLLGECHKDNGNLRLAILAFENTLVLCDNHVGAHHNLAVAYHLQRDIVNAQHHYNAALQLEPKNGLLLQNYKKFQAIHRNT